MTELDDLLKRFESIRSGEAGSPSDQELFTAPAAKSQAPTNWDALEERLTGVYEQSRRDRGDEQGYLETIGKGLVRGTQGIASGVGSIGTWAGEATGIEPLAKAGKWTSEYFDKAAREGWAAPDPVVFKGSFMDRPSLKRAAGIVSEALPSLAAALFTGGVAAGGLRAAGMAAGAAQKVGAAAGAFGLGALEGAPQYEEARKAGKTIGEASTLAGVSTIGTGLLEFLPISRMLKPMAKKGGFGKYLITAAERGGEESAQEGTQQIFQNAIARYGYDATRDLTEGLVESIIGGFGSGAIAGTTSSRINRWIEDKRSKGIPDAQISNDIDAIGNAVAGDMERHADNITQAPVTEEITRNADAIIKEAEATEIDPEDILLGRELPAEEIPPAVRSFVPGAATAPRAVEVKPESALDTLYNRLDAIRKGETHPAPIQEVAPQPETRPFVPEPQPAVPGPELQAPQPPPEAEVAPPEVLPGPEAPPPPAPPAPPAPATPAVEAAKKEPWEITAGQASLESAKEIFPIKGSVDVVNEKPVYTYSWRDVEITSRGPLNGVQSSERLHKKIVERALAEGKPVPASVLADYPDLAKQAAPEAPQAAKATEAEPEATTAPKGPVQRPASLNILQEKHIRGRIDKLGSLEAVNKTYSGDTVVDKYARALAQEKFAGKAAAPVEVKAQAAVAPTATTPTEKPAKFTGTIGRAWVGDQQRNITAAKEITRGKRKGWYLVTFTDGKTKNLPADAISQMPVAATAEPQPTAKPEKFIEFVHAAKIPTKKVDWGKLPRGQGKRVGGMIKGAMSGAPTGVKSYIDFKNANGVTPEVWDEIKYLDDLEKHAAIGAIQNGKTLDEAMKIVYSRQDETKEAAPTTNIERRPDGRMVKIEKVDEDFTKETDIELERESKRIKKEGEADFADFVIKTPSIETGPRLVKTTPPPPVTPKGKPGEKATTLRGAIKAMGGLNFLNLKGEVKDFPPAVRMSLIRTTGEKYDRAEQRLKEEGWLRPEEELVMVLRDANNMRRGKVAGEGIAKREQDLTEQEKRVKREMEREPEAPPEGDYITMSAEDLPEGKKLTIIDDRAKEGWDVYEVTEKDPFGVTLKDGKAIELKPGDKIQVRREDLPEKEQEEAEEPEKLHQYWKTDDGKVVVVQQGPDKAGGWTFYAKEDTAHLSDRGTRIRGRGQRLWYDTKDEALKALQEYALGRGWKPIGTAEAPRKILTPQELARKMMTEAQSSEEEKPSVEKERPALVLQGEKVMPKTQAEMRVKGKKEGQAQQGGLEFGRPETPEALTLKGEKVGWKEASRAKKIIEAEKAPEAPAPKPEAPAGEKIESRRERALREYKDYLDTLSNENKEAVKDLILESPESPSLQISKIQKAISELGKETPAKVEKTKETESQVNRLRKTAESLKKTAEEKYNADRLENTPKRARQGESARAQASHDIAIAETMMKIADGIEAGDLKALNSVYAKSHVELLDNILTQAQYARYRKENISYGEQQRRKGEPITEADIKYARMPHIFLGDGMIPGVQRDLSEKRGGKKLADRIRGEYLDREFAKELVDFAKNNNIELPWMIESGLKKLNQLKQIGVTNKAELDAALKEYVELKAEKKKESPIKKLEAEVRFVKIPGFFPTPKSLRERMINEADIKPGMRVLEPSAGKGDIADDIKDAGVTPDVIEINSKLQEILKAKGYELAGTDFMDYSNGGYDRIVMNPPFENLQDIDHVGKAFDLLKPGGRLVSIMSPAPFFRSGNKSENFRNWFESVNGTVEDVPAGAFKGIEAFRETGVASKLVVIDKPLSGAPTLARVGEEATKAPTARSLGLQRANVDRIKQLVPFVQRAMKQAGLSQDVIDLVKIDLKPIIDLQGKDIEQTLADWAKEGKTASQVLGATTMRKWSALVELSTEQDLNSLEKTAFHESFHIAAKWLLPESDYNRLMSHYRTEEGAAEAFADFVSRRSGGQPAPVGAVRRVLLKLRNLFNQIGAYLKGQGITNPEDIFGRLAAGEYAPHFEAWGQGETTTALQAGKQDTIKAAYDKLKDERGYSNIEISDIRDRAGITQAQMEDYLKKQAELQNIVLTTGDYSVSSPAIRSGAIKVDWSERPMLLVRIDDPLPQSQLRLGRREEPTASVFDEVAPAHAQEQLKKAFKGVDTGPVLDRIKEKASEFVKFVTPGREYLHLEPKFWGKAINSLRGFKDAGNYGKKTSELKLREILDPIIKLTAKDKAAGKRAYEAFTLKIALEDLTRELSEGGKYADWQGLVEKHGSLQFGFKSADEVAETLRKVDAIVEGNPTVKDALERRDRITREVLQDVVNAKLLPEDVLKDPRYFHHQVLEYLNENYSAGTGAGSFQVGRKGYQRSRIENIKDFSLNYLQSEFEVLAHQLTQLQRKKYFDRVDQEYNIANELQQQAKRANYVAVVGGQENMNRIEYLRRQIADLRSQGGLDADEKKMLKEWAAEIRDLDPTMPFRQRMAIGFSKLSKVMGLDVDEFGDVDSVDMAELAQLANSTDETVSIPARSIFKAMGERNAFIQDTLGRNYLTAVDLAKDRKPLEGSTGWTEYVPNPRSAWYTVGSIQDATAQQIMAGSRELQESDIRPVLARGRDDVWIIPTELAQTLEGKEFDVKAQDENVISRFSEKTLNAWKRWVLMNPMRIMKYNLNNLSGDADITFAYDPKIFKEIPQAARDLWKWHYNKEMSPALKAEFDKALEHDGISSGLTAKDIPDISDQAGLRAITQAVGADSRSALRYIENFWQGSKNFTAWRENVLRLAAARHFEKQIKAGKKVYGASEQSKVDAATDIDEKKWILSRDLVGDYGAISPGGQWLRRKLIPFYSWWEVNAPRYYRLYKNLAVEGQPEGRRLRMGAVAAKQTATLSAKVFAMYAAAQMFNHLVWPDEEEELGEVGRRQAHVILGRREDGSIITVRLQGALSDALSWMGLEDFPEDLRQLAAGKKTVGKFATEAALAPVQKFVQGTRPEFKGAAELLTGKALYPDFTKPRPIRDYGEHIAQMLSADALYRRAAGKPLRGGTTEQRVLSDLLSVFTYSAEPGEVAYYKSRDLVNEFLKEHNLERPISEPTNRMNALYYYKQAIKLGDAKAAEKYLEEYKALGGKQKDIQMSVKRAHPLGSLPNRERARFFNSLDAEDRQTVKRGSEWYRSTFKSGV